MHVNRCLNPNCEFFNHALPNNAKVCPWCSTPLSNVIASKPPQPSPQPDQPSKPVQEAPPAPDQSNYQPPHHYPPQPNYSTSYQQRPAHVPSPPAHTPLSPRLPILKLVHTSGKEFRLSQEAGYIGRRSQSMPIAPEIDLTSIPNEGIVSRRHARVYWDWSQNAYMIIDMSTNGIYLNGNLLTPGMPYRLINGDLLQLGQENLVIFTVYLM